MGKKLQIEIPEETYEKLLRRARGPEGVESEILAAIETRVSSKTEESDERCDDSLLSIIGIGTGDRSLSTKVDDVLYGGA